MTKKIGLLLFGILILCGCTIDANVTVDKDYSLNENYIVSFNNSLADAYYTVKEYADNYISYYKSAIDYKNYTYKFNSGDVDTSYVEFKRTTTDFCKGINSNLFASYLYDNILCTEENGYYIIKSNGNNKINLPADERKFDIEEINLNITLPLEATYNNADSVDYKTYTWKFDKNTENSKNIYLKINKNDLDNKIEKLRKQNENKKKTIAYVFYILLAAVISVIGFSLFKKYKKNKVEY